MELDQERRQHVSEIGMSPEVVAGCVQPTFGEADFGPEKITVKRVHSRIPAG
jgi:hypothetical protein